MPGAKRLNLAKLAAIAGFLVLVSSTYYLRNEVLTLNKIGFSADQMRAEFELDRFLKDYPQEVERHRVAVKNYELQKKHYEGMLALYESDYDAYVKRIKDEYRPPQLPQAPSPPQPPELKQQLASINAQFRTQKYDYFRKTSVLNWIALAAALALTGGLLYLLMFDAANGRLFYFMTLVLSFVFLIGPAFHSILSAIIGLMEAPRVY